MTRYYLYIKAGLKIDADTRFYKVGIGESSDQLRIKEWLTAYAAQHGHFFVLWSDDTAEFFCKCCEQIGADDPCLVTAKGSQLKRWLSDGLDDGAFYQAELHRLKLLAQVDHRVYSDRILIFKRHR